jgi:DNA sulfur modification protein DndD
MRIKSIKINNIGPFSSGSFIDLQTDKSKNVVLIGGHNGSGKTTLLKAIKVCLFGSYIFGSKYETKQYFDYVEQMLNYHSFKDDFSITLEIETVFDGIPSLSRLKRTWHKKTGSLQEELIIEKFDFESNKYKLEENLAFVENLISFYSPSLIDSLLIDGEKISQLIDNGRVSKYIEEAFNSIFNIEKVKNISDKINKLSQAFVKTNNPSKDYELLEIFNKIEDTKKEIFRNKELNKDLDESIKKLSSELQGRIKKYNLSTSNIKDEYLEKLKLLDRKKYAIKEIQESLKASIEENAIYLINIKTFENILLKAEKKLPAKIINDLDIIEEFTKVDFSKVKNEILKKYNINYKDKRFFKLDLSEFRKITDKLSSLKLIAFSLKENQAKLSSLSIEVQKIEDSFKKMPDMNTVIEDSILIETLRDKIKELTDKKEGLVKNFDNLNNTLKDQISFFETLESKIKSTNNSETLVSNSVNYRNAFNIFVSRITESKLKEISKMTLNIFNLINSKKAHIIDLNISSDFDLTVKLDEKTNLPINSLSAGEIQLLVISLIYSMIKISGRRVTVVLDTPLARLDKENRSNFIKYILSDISERTIILSTDYEFDNLNYSFLKSKIYKSYMLKFSKKSKTTSVLEKYYDWSEKNDN